MTFISALLSLGFFILIFKAMAKDISSTQSKSTDEQPDLVKILLKKLIVV